MLRKSKRHYYQHKFNIIKNIYEKYMEFLCFYMTHFGFRENHSSSMALVHLTDRIVTALDNKEFTIGVFIDLSKVFDTVDHNVLLNELQA